MTFRADVDALMHRHGIPLDMKDLRAQWDKPLIDASLEAKTSVIVRAGVIDMRSGVSSFGVRQLMNNLACALGVYIRTNVNFANIEIECTDGQRRISEIVDMPTVGVNTEHLWLMEHFCDWALGRLGKPSMYYGDSTASEAVMNQVCAGKRRIHVPATPGAKAAKRAAMRAGTDEPVPAAMAQRPLTLGEAHAKLDAIEGKASSYSALFSAFAGGIACACFVFLLSGGPYDMLAAFFGAGAGQFLRKKMAARHYNEFLTVTAAVVLALLVFFATLGVASIWSSTALLHTTSYVGAILFVVPGFPLVTGGLDLAKGNVQTGIQRLTYAFAVLFIATLAAWGVAWISNLSPQAFAQPAIPAAVLLILRFVCSFIAVWGFSVMFSSTPAIACTAALIGAIANTVRLEAVDALACRWRWRRSWRRFWPVCWRRLLVRLCGAERCLCALDFHEFRYRWRLCCRWCRASTSTARFTTSASSPRSMRLTGCSAR